MDETLKKIIKTRVEPGCKGTELVVNVIGDLRQMGAAKTFSARLILDAINEMVKTGEILEVEYILPHIDYRVKSFYLPAGTKIRAIGTNIRVTTSS